MKCPACGLYHPPQYEQCVSCGATLDAAGESPAQDEGAHAAALTPVVPSLARAPVGGPQPVTVVGEPAGEPADEEIHHTRRSKAHKQAHKSGLPTAIGVAVTLTILLVSAGATVFFLTKPADDELLFQEAQRQLANGQYAFAVKSLEKVAAVRPRDARVYLTLARAYVGIDQVDKAWECISQAQQLGSGVVSDPVLASELSNYYRQHGQYEKAIELLRPLAQANIQNKKAELADLDALWGDDALRDGNLDRALACWEEVRDLREGTRYSEADARLSTIYQKMVGKLITQKNDQEALALLAKLNTIAENAANYERAAEIYERRGQLELAIDQLRRAIRLPSKALGDEKRLASLMSRRGKELLDAGDTQGGYGYLQEARALDPLNVVPAVTARNVTITVEGGSSFPRITGEIWNPGTEPVKMLTIKVELWSGKAQKVLWEREQKIIDEFVAPLSPQETKPFDMIASYPVRSDGATEFKFYIDGGLYKSYPIGGQAEAASATREPGDKEKKEEHLPPPAPNVVPVAAPPREAPPAAPVQPPAEPASPPKQDHPEDQTLKDLEL